MKCLKSQNKLRNVKTLRALKAHCHMALKAHCHTYVFQFQNIWVWLLNHSTQHLPMRNACELFFSQKLGFHGTHCRYIWYPYQHCIVTVKFFNWSHLAVKTSQGHILLIFVLDSWVCPLERLQEILFPWLSLDLESRMFWELTYSWHL